jgi:hypothetical protein
MRGLAFICVIACGAIADQAAAQSADAAEQPPPAQIAAVAPAADMKTVAAKTVVDIEIAQSLDSKTTKPGERFAIKLASPIVVGGRTLVPAGITGEGEVVHAAKARWGGKAGELVLAARYLDCGPTRITLGYFKFGAAGENRAATALGASIIVPFAGFLIAGGEMRVPSGTRANAKVRSDIQFTEGAGPACAPPDASPSAPAGG